MATILGKITDSNGSPIEFATVYVSDSKGSPVVPNRNTSTDANGNYKLVNVNESDYITARQVGLTPTTIAANKMVKVPVINPLGGSSISVPTLNITLKQNVESSLPEIEVTANKVKKNNTLRNIFIVGSLLALLGVAYGLKKANN